MNIRKIVLIITLLTAGSVFAATPKAPAEKGTLPGTWLTTVTPPPESGVPPFTLLFTFTSDHNLLATGTAGDFPALGNPCHGSWSLGSTDGEYALTYLCLDFDGNLQFTGMDRIVARLTVEGSDVSGRLRLTNYDPTGAETFSACCAGLTGSKLEVESLDETASNSRRGSWLRR